MTNLSPLSGAGGETGAGAAFESFIIVHDQALLLACEAEGRYRHIPAPRFVFVGDGPVERVADRDDVVVARRLAVNLEDRRHLLAFTAWFAVAKNRLGSAPYVALLEYDVEATAAFSTSTLGALEAAPRTLVGYVPMPLSDPRFAHTNTPFVSALQEAHGIDVQAVVTRHLESTGSDLWTATSNLALSRESLEAFVDWYLPVADLLGDDPLGGHVHERALAIFAALEGRGTTCLRGVLAHSQEASHGVGIELRRTERTGSRRLAPATSDPELSVVIVAHQDGDRLLETLRTVTPEYQTGVPVDSYEVIVVDDASWPPLDREAILTTAEQVRHIHRGAADPNPVRAVELGVEMARGERLAIFPDRGEPLAPGLLLWATRTFDLFEDSVTRIAIRARSGSPPGGAGAILCRRRRFVQLGGFAGIAQAAGAGALRAPVSIDLEGEATLRPAPGAGAGATAEVPRLPVSQDGGASDRELEGLTAELSDQSRRLAAALEKADQLRLALADSQKTLRRTAKRADEQSRELAATRSRLAAREGRLAQLLASRSWRFTAPLRGVLSRLRSRPRRSPDRSLDDTEADRSKPGS